MLSSATKLESGSRVGPYEVREHIGDGGMATVYKAWHTGLERFEALKIPRVQSSPAGEADFVQRLLAEARTAAGLHHPHIVAIHNVSDADSSLPFFAMDFVPGGDLQQLIKERGRLPIEEALPILRQVGEALDYAHSRGVIHRDIKPANILLHEDSHHTVCSAKVVDFGISHAAEDPGGTRLTAGGMFVGTPEYMSPEQSGSGAPVDYRTDIYSLGVVAYEMLCGQPPFVAGEGVSRISIIMKHATQSPPPPAQHLTNLPPALNDAVMKALAKAPEERFQSCAEFLQALDTARVTPGVVAANENGHTIAARPATSGTLAARLQPAATASIAAAGDTVVAPPAPTNTAVPAKDVEQLRTLLKPQPASRRSLLFASLGAMAAAALFIFWVASSQLRPSPSVLPAPAATAPAATATTEKRPTPTVRTVAKTAAKAQSTPVLQVKRVSRRSTVQYPRQMQKTFSLLTGQTRLKQRGQNGIKEVVLEISYRGAREMSRRILSSRIIRQPVAEVQLSGTKTPVAAKPAVVRRTTQKAAPAKVVRKRTVRRVAPVRSVRKAKPRNTYKPGRTFKAKRTSPARRRQTRQRSYSGGEAPLPP